MDVARAIIRLSMNKDKGEGALRPQVREILREAGFESRGTAVWEASGLPVAPLLQAVARAAEVLQREPSPLRPGTLDHLWIYVDNPD
jgi:hypothetical protein